MAVKLKNYRKVWWSQQSLDAAQISYCTFHNESKFQEENLPIVAQFQMISTTSANSALWHDCGLIFSIINDNYRRDIRVLISLE